MTAFQQRPTAKAKIDPDYGASIEIEIHNYEGFDNLDVLEAESLLQELRDAIEAVKAAPEGRLIRQRRLRRESRHRTNIGPNRSGVDRN